MAPTLRGASNSASCTACQLVWLVDSATDPASRSDWPCPHCGQPAVVAESASSPDLSVAADVVAIRRVNDSDRETLKRGQLVAVRYGGRVQLKRIAAITGDEVTLDGLRLIVNGSRLEDLLLSSEQPIELPQFLVDDDARRERSRWSSEPGNGWTFEAPGKWRTSESDPASAPWLVYEHRSVHDRNLISPVWDDYPYNIGLERQLLGVDRLSLSGRIDSDSKVRLEVGFWSEKRSVSRVIEVEGGQPFSVSFYDAVESSGIPVSDTRPVAIRVLGEAATLTGLTIRRSIEYRLRPRDDRNRYPLVIGPSECFVLGDNVPVSVDSRDVGIVATDNIVGTVVAESP